jgi:serine protease Do
MRAQLLQLSGPRRGRTETFDDANVLIGTDPDAAFRFRDGVGVAGRHAEIAFDECGCEFHIKAIGGEVFVNGREVREVILAHGDLIEFGAGGPKARFRVHADKGPACKPVRSMLGDAREVGREGGVFAFTESFARDLLTHSTPLLKVGFPIALIVVFGISAWLGGWIGARTAAQTRLEAEIEVVRSEFEKLREAEEVSRADIDRLRDGFAKRAAAVDRQLLTDETLKSIHDRYSRGVCLIHGIYSVRHPPVAGVPGEFMLDAWGEQLEIEYTGSGFLVSDSGQVVTNRHIARPWEYEPQLAPLLAAGFVPEFQRLRACFPGKLPIDVDPSETRLRAGDAFDVAFDVAVLRVDVEDAPVLPLDDRDPFTLRGRPTVVVGYPTGVTALLAKADAAIANEVTESARPQPVDHR